MKVKINTLHGFEDISDAYWITDTGHVLSTYLKPHYIKERKTRPTKKSKNEYFEVCLAKKHDRKSKKYIKVHRLVALAFIKNENPETRTQVNHINKNGYDNRAENLEWTTPSENSMWSNAKEVYCYNAEGLYKIYSSVKSAEKDGFNSGHVASVCRGDIPKGRKYPELRHKGFTFSYSKLSQKEVVQRLSKRHERCTK